MAHTGLPPSSRRLQVLLALQALAASLLGFGLAVLLTWVVLQRLHPRPLTALIGLSTAGALLAGWPIGLVAARWTRVAAVVAWLAFVPYPIRVLSPLWMLPMGLFGPLVTMPLGVMLAFVASLLFGLVGAEAGRRCRAQVWRVLVGSCLLVAAFSGIFIVPEVVRVVEADRFMRTRQGEVADLLSRSGVNVPAKAAWSHRLSRNLNSALAVEAAWNVRNARTASNTASLTLHLARGYAHSRLESSFQDLTVNFRPGQEWSPATRSEAEALVGKVGITPGIALAADGSQGWSAYWPDRTDGGTTTYELKVGAHGAVDLRRSSYVWVPQ